MCQVIPTANANFLQIPCISRRAISLNSDDPKRKTWEGEQEDGISFHSGVFHRSVAAVIRAGGGTVTLSVDLQNTWPVGSLEEFNVSKL